jgi:hypothetical protein
MKAKVARLIAVASSLAAVLAAGAATFKVG